MLNKGSSTPRLIVFCSVQPHNTPPPYLTRIAHALAANNFVIFIDLPTSEYKTRLKHSLSVYFRMAVFLFHPTRLFLWSPIAIPIGLHYRLFELFLFLFRLIHGSKIVLYTTSPKPDSIYHYIHPDFSLFDCYDNPDNELVKNRQNILHYHQVSANFPRLYAILTDLHPHPHLVSSGFHNHIYKKRTSKQILNTVVFYGGISHRITFDWLQDAIRSLPDIHFIFIGEKYLNRYYIESNDNHYERLWNKIVDLPNVHFWNTTIDPESAPAVLSQFMVGIIPYDPIDSYNYNSHPIKFYDYLASNIPVISTPLPSMISYSPTAPVFIAHDSNEFTALIQQYASRPYPLSPSTTKNVRKILARHSIKTKLRQFEMFFRQHRV